MNTAGGTKMNKTQKGAWFGLSGVLLVIILCTYLGVDIFIKQRLPNKNLVWVVAIFCVLVGGAGLIWTRRKQSPKEADSDERDKSIEKKAVLVSFISVWLLLAAETLIPRFIVGLDGSIPVWMLAIINVAIFYVAMAVYFTTVLIQYSWRSRNGEN
jgi:uncharacterized membrane-anchored protein